MNLAQAVDPERLSINRDMVPEPAYPPLWTHFEVVHQPPEPERSKKCLMCMPKNGTALRAIYSQIEAKSGICSSEITAALKMRRRYVAIYLCDLRSRELVESSGPRRNPNWKVRVE